MLRELKPKLLTFESVEAAGEPLWSRAARDGGFLLSYPWLRAEVERPGERAAYTVLGDARLPAGVAAAYLVERDAFACYDANWLLNGGHEGLDCGARQYRQGPYPVLTCAAPGHRAGIHLLPQAGAEQVEAYLDRFDDQAGEWQAPAQAFLYLKPGRQPLLEEALLRRGYRRFLVGAESALDTPWDDFDGYLASLGRRKRWKVEHERRIFQGSGLRLERCGAEGLDADLASLQAELRGKYGHAVDLDRTLSDQARIRERLGPYVRLFKAYRGRRAVGFTLFYQYGDALWSRTAGFDYARLQGEFCYFNLLFYEPIKAAIEAGLERIEYGMGAYAAKSNRGCSLRPTVGFLRYPARLAGELEDRIRRYEPMEAEALARQGLGDLP